MVKGSEDDIALVDTLRKMEISEEVIAYLLTSRVSKWLATLYDFAMVAVMAFGFLIGAVLWVIVSGYSEQAAMAHARLAQGVMYEDIFGFSGLAALFAWIFASGFIVTSPKLIPERVVVSAFAYSLANKSRHSISWRRACEKVDKSMEPAALVRRVFARQGEWGKWPAILLFLLAFMLIEYEMGFHTIYTRNGVIERADYGLGKWRNTSWSNVQSVELGCNHITGKGASDDAVYKINFEDGRSIRLDNARPVSGSWLDAIETIDFTLAEAGAEFKRWSWLNRNPLHPECLAANRARMSERDFDRLLKLLRVSAEDLSVDGDR